MIAVDDPGAQFSLRPRKPQAASMRPRLIAVDDPDVLKQLDSDAACVVQ